MKNAACALFAMVFAVATQSSAYAQPQASLCGKLSTSNFVTCFIMNSNNPKYTITCPGSGYCDANDKCKKRPGFATTGENTFPVDDWTKRFYGLTDDRDFKITQNTLKCFELMNCKDDCAMGPNGMECKMGTTLIGHLDIIENVEDGPCPDEEA